MNNGDSATANWLTIATLIVAIITAVINFVMPLLSVYIQQRMAQPKPKPEANQPKSLSRKIFDWYAAHPALTGLMWIGFMLGLFTSALSRENGPVTYATVLSIAVTVGVIVLQILFIFLNLYTNRFTAAIRDLQKMEDSQNRLLDELIDTLESRAQAPAVPAKSQEQSGILKALLKKLTD